MKNETAKDIMRSPEVALSRDMTLDKVSDHLTRHNLPGAPVVDANKKPIGYVSEYDCLQQLMQSSYYCDNTSLVEDVMSTKLIVSGPDIPIIDLASLMNNSKVNVMPSKVITYFIECHVEAQCHFRRTHDVFGSFIFHILSPENVSFRLIGLVNRLRVQRIHQYLY